MYLKQLLYSALSTIECDEQAITWLFRAELLSLLRAAGNFGKFLTAIG
jgi:hypothetical protein